MPSRKVSLDLVLRAQSGDHLAFEELMRLTVGDLAGLAQVLLGSRQDVEDAIQESFMRAWRGLRQLRDPRRFDPWMRRLVVNVCIDQRRNRGAQAALLRRRDDRVVGDHAEGIAEHLVLIEALRGLAPNHMVVLALAYYRDLSTAEIAAALDIPPGTAKSRIHHALRALRSAVEAQSRGPVSERGV